jgi:hypothetical protein
VNCFLATQRGFLFLQFLRESGEGGGHLHSGLQETGHRSPLMILYTNFCSQFGGGAKQNGMILQGGSFRVPSGFAVTRPADKK